MVKRILWGSIILILFLILLILPGTADTTLELKEGWNFVSIPLTNPQYQYPDYPVYCQFSKVDTASHSIWTYDAATKQWLALTKYSKITPLDGVWVYSVKTMTLPVPGDNSVSPAPKRLEHGWNMVGFAGAAQPAYQAFSSVSGNWQMLMGYDTVAGRYEKTVFNSDPSNKGIIAPGKGYFVYMDQAGDYAVPAATFPVTTTIPTTIQTTVPTSGPTAVQSTVMTTIPTAVPTSVHTTIPTPGPTTVPTAVAYIPYSNARARFQVNYPSTWSVNEINMTMMGINAWMIMLYDTADYSPFFLIDEMDNLGLQVPVQEIVDETAVKMRDQGYTVYDPYPITIGGSPAYAFRYSNAGATGIQILSITGTGNYIIGMAAKTEDFPYHEQVFNEMIGSFRFL